MDEPTFYCAMKKSNRTEACGLISCECHAKHRALLVNAGRLRGSVFDPTDFRILTEQYSPFNTINS